VNNRVPKSLQGLTVVHIDTWKLHNGAGWSVCAWAAENTNYTGTVSQAEADLLIQHYALSKLARQMTTAVQTDKTLDSRQTSWWW